MTTNKNKRVKGEKILITLITLLVVGNIFGPSFSMALLSKTNFEVEDLKMEISKQESKNESLEMKINELASLDNVEAIASNYGLEYNNSNIRVLGE